MAGVLSSIHDAIAAPPSFDVVRDEAGDIKGVKSNKAAIFDNLHGAINGQQEKITAPRQPIRVIRDENGDIQGIQ